MRNRAADMQNYRMLVIAHPPTAGSPGPHHRHAGQRRPQGIERGQGADLLGLRLDPRVLRQDQGDQVITGEGEESCAVHALP